MSTGLRRSRWWPALVAGPVAAGIAAVDLVAKSLAQARLNSGPVD